MSTETAMRILTVLNQPKTALEILNQTGIKIGPVKSVLKKLVAHKIVVRNFGGDQKRRRWIYYLR